MGTLFMSVMLPHGGVRFLFAPILVVCSKKYIVTGSAVVESVPIESLYLLLARKVSSLNLKISTSGPVSS